jgi:hypothetical protein
MKPVSAFSAIAIVVGVLSGATVHELASALGAEHTIVRVEQSNRRGFVVLPAAATARSSELCSALRAIMIEIRRGDAGTDAWAISIFDREQYATDKTEVQPQEMPQWSQSYLGEFDRDGILWTHPMFPAKKEKHDMRECLRGTNADACAGVPST